MCLGVCFGGRVFAARRGWCFLCGVWVFGRGGGWGGWVDGTCAGSGGLGSWGGAFFGGAGGGGGGVGVDFGGLVWGGCGGVLEVSPWGFFGVGGGGWFFVLGLVVCVGIFFGFFVVGLGVFLGWFLAGEGWGGAGLWAVRYLGVGWGCLGFGGSGGFWGFLSEEHPHVHVACGARHFFFDWFLTGLFTPPVSPGVFSGNHSSFFPVPFRVQL